MRARCGGLRPAQGRRLVAGITLIELLIVMAIMGLLAAVALPMVGDQRAFRLRLVEVQVETAMNHARSLASANAATHGVVFDLTANAFAVVDQAGQPVTDPLTRQGYVVTFDRPDQPKGIDFTGASFGSTGRAAIFGPDGLPEAGGTITVNCLGSVMTITLDQATGKVTAS
ncbi:MAG: pilus assembly FimT family protein [Planctomycetota bacterium]